MTQGEEREGKRERDEGESVVPVRWSSVPPRHRRRRGNCLAMSVPPAFHRCSLALKGCRAAQRDSQGGRRSASNRNTLRNPRLKALERSNI